MNFFFSLYKNNTKFCVALGYSDNFFEYSRLIEPFRDIFTVFSEIVPYIDLKGSVLRLSI